MYLIEVSVGGVVFTDCIIAKSAVAAYEVAELIGEKHQAEEIYIGPLLGGWKIKLTKSQKIS